MLTLSISALQLFLSSSCGLVLDGTYRSAWEGVRERRTGGCLKRSGVHLRWRRVCGERLRHPETRADQPGRSVASVNHLVGG